MLLLNEAQKNELNSQRALELMKLNSSCLWMRVQSAAAQRTEEGHGQYVVKRLLGRRSLCEGNSKYCVRLIDLM